MIKFVVTSPGFVGEFHLVYGDDRRLLQLDMLPAELRPEQIEYIKNRVPVIYDEPTFIQSFGKANLEFIPSDFEITFEMFWAKYRKKINKGRCLVLWRNLKQVDQVKAYFGITVYDNFLSSLPYARAKVDPERYLRDRAWENEWK